MIQVYALVKPSYLSTCSTRDLSGFVAGGGCIAAMVIESWAHCVAGPLLEVMDKLRLGYPQGMLLLPVIKLAADITDFSNVFVCLQWGIVCGTHCTS